MPNTYENTYEHIKNSLKAAEVAHAARVQYTSWVRSHIFDSVGQHILGKNRGRLPYVSFEPTTTDFSIAAHDGQMEDFSWIVRVDVGGASVSGSRHKMEQQANAIIRAFMREFTSNVQWKGVETSVGELVETPFGGYKDVTISHSFPDCDYDFNEGDDL